MLCPDGEFAQEAGWACRPAGEEGGDPPAGTADLFWSRQAPRDPGRDTPHSHPGPSGAGDCLHPLTLGLLRLVG